MCERKIEDVLRRAEKMYRGVEVMRVSALTGEGIDALRARIQADARASVPIAGAYIEKTGK